MIWVHHFARAKTLKWILQQYGQRKDAWIHYSTLNNLFLLLHTLIKTFLEKFYILNNVKRVGSPRITLQLNF